MLFPKKHPIKPKKISSSLGGFPALRSLQLLFRDLKEVNGLEKGEKKNTSATSTHKHIFALYQELKSTHTFDSDRFEIIFTEILNGSKNDDFCPLYEELLYTCLARKELTASLVDTRYLSIKDKIINASQFAVAGVEISHADIIHSYFHTLPVSSDRFYSLIRSLPYPEIKHL